MWHVAFDVISGVQYLMLYVLCGTAMAYGVGMWCLALVMACDVWHLA